MANDSGSFAGKVAFVTGAANGIGRAAALAFAREGVSVVAADVSELGNQETARTIEEAGGRSLAVKCDVSQGDDVKAALDKAIKTFGRLDFASTMPVSSNRSWRRPISRRRSGSGPSTSIFAACSCA